MKLSVGKKMLIRPNYACCLGEQKQIDLPLQHHPCVGTIYRLKPATARTGGKAIVE